MACYVYTLYFIHYDTLCTLDHSLLLRARITDDDDVDGLLLLLPGGDNYYYALRPSPGQRDQSGRSGRNFLGPRRVKEVTEIISTVLLLLLLFFNPFASLHPSLTHSATSWLVTAL